jgi:AbrB family looped-hinge helix DNA binding protein
MAEVTKVQSRNQITLPKEVRRASGIKAGDSVLVRSTGPGTIEVRTFPRMTFEESLEKYHVDECVDVNELRRAVEEGIVADVLRTLANE